MERTSDEAGKVSSRQVLCSLVDYSTSSWRCPVAERIQLEDTGGFPGSSVGKESACSARDLGSIPWFGQSPGEGNGKPLQYPCLKNPMDRGAWWAAVHGIEKSWA